MESRLINQWTGVCIRWALRKNELQELLVLLVLEELPKMLLNLNKEDQTIWTVMKDEVRLL